MGKNDEINEPSGLEDISDLFPPSAPASPSPVGNFSMKLPAFWPDAAEVLFAQADMQFGIRNVLVSKTKFYTLLQSFLKKLLLISWISSAPLQLVILMKFSGSVS